MKMMIDTKILMIKGMVTCKWKEEDDEDDEEEEATKRRKKV